MKDYPLVSVIISAYNAEKYIKKCIDSALNQAYPCKEIVVCDDGSTDGTSAILGSFGNRIKCIRQENAGQGRGRNNAAVHCQGELLAFLDADDQWLPEKTHLQVDRFKGRSNVGAVYSDMFITRENSDKMRLYASGRMARGSITDNLLKESFIGLSSLMVRRDYFVKVGGFSDHRYCQDYVFLLSLARICEFDYVDKPLVLYLEHANNVTKNLTLSCKEPIEFLEKYKAEHELSASQVLSVNRQISKLFGSYAYLSFVRGEPDEARNAVLQASEMGYTDHRLSLVSLLSHPALGSFSSAMLRVIRPLLRR